MELGDVPVHSLVPSALSDIKSVGDFMQMLPEYDDDMAQQLAEAEAQSECLRFVGEPLSCGRVGEPCASPWSYFEVCWGPPGPLYFCLHVWASSRPQADLRCAWSTGGIGAWGSSLAAGMQLKPGNKLVAQAADPAAWRVYYYKPLQARSLCCCSQAALSGVSGTMASGAAGGSVMTN